MSALAVVLLAIAAGPDLELSPPTGPVQFELTPARQQAVESAWTEFLTRYFRHFDRNGDGKLDRKETDRVPPLPLPERRSVAFDFQRADANGDGAIAISEWRDFYRQAGFRPVVGQVEPTPPELARVNATLWTRLDRDGDGRLSQVELTQAKDLLWQLDDNEDEALTPAEILAGSATKALVPKPARPVASMNVTVDWPVGEAPRFAMPPARGIWSVVARPVDRVADVRSTRQFLLAQFHDASAGEKTLSRADAEADPAAQVLVELFGAADRDGDGQLARTELESWLDLVQAGVLCQVQVALRERPRSLFDALDEDGDGRITLRELHAARRLLGERPTLPLDELPTRYAIELQQGSEATVFGFIPVGRRPAVPANLPTTRKPSAAPRWFQAADRNGDDVLSPREFPGPAELFRRLDRDSDGVLTPEEAAAR